MTHFIIRKIIKIIHVYQFKTKIFCDIKLSVWKRVFKHAYSHYHRALRGEYTSEISIFSKILLFFIAQN